MTTTAPVEQESAYRAQVLALAALAAAEMTDAVGLPVPDPVFVAVGVAVVARAASRATAAADLSLSTVLAEPGTPSRARRLCRSGCCPPTTWRPAPVRG